VGLVTYTNLGSPMGRFLSPRRGCTHHLTYAIAAESKAGAEAVSWVDRRTTSSRRGARWNERILRRGHGCASFLFESDELGVELSARSARGEELYLRARAGGSSGSLFPTPMDVLALLRSTGSARPRDHMIADPDPGAAGDGVAPEPLTVLEVRGSFFEQPTTEAGGPVLDGVWQLTSRRRNPLVQPEGSSRRVMLATGDRAVPAL
jgi:hypothetical protein